MSGSRNRRVPRARIVLLTVALAFGGLALAGEAAADPVALTLIGQTWTGSGATGASAGGGSLSGGSYGGNVLASVNAGSSCNSVWTFWCWGDSDSQWTMRSWDVWLGLDGEPGDSAQLALDWELQNVVGLYALALGFSYVSADVTFGWQVWDAETGLWSASAGFTENDGVAVDLVDTYVDTRTVSGASQLGLLQVGDILRLTGSFRDQASTELLMLGTLSATSFAFFDYHVTATPVPRPVPEPATAVLLGMGACALGVWRRRRPPSLPH